MKYNRAYQWADNSVMIIHFFSIIIELFSAVLAQYSYNVMVT
jgi:hypothetical protein